MAADTPRASRARVPSAGQEPPRRTRAADDDAKLHESDKKRPKISVPLPASVKNLFASRKWLSLLLLRERVTYRSR
jgi:hypothetical protein